MNKKYGKHDKVSITRSKIHEYIGMKFEFGKGEVKVDIIKYMKEMLKEFSIKFKKGEKVISPVTANMFNKDNSKRLNQKEKEIFHRTTTKVLYAGKRVRPDLLPVISALCMRVKNLGRNDWNKLVRIMKFITGTINDKLMLSVKNGLKVEQYVDAAFAVHPDFRVIQVV